MQAGGLQEEAAPAVSPEPALTVRRMYTPEQTGHADMLAGGTGAVADKIIELLRSRGLVKG
jgi:electron transfer flavoprotein beta subunit